MGPVQSSFGAWVISVGRSRERVGRMRQELRGEGAGDTHLDVISL